MHMKKKILIVLSALLLALAVWGIIAATKKHYLQFKLLAEIPVAYIVTPMAYEIFHHQEDLERFWDRTSETRELRRKLPAGTKFDFKRYSYGIFFGRKVTAMWHSWKESKFDEPAPQYPQDPASIPVFVSYESDSTSAFEWDSKSIYELDYTLTGPVYLYEFPRDTRLRGFLGP